MKSIAELRKERIQILDSSERGGTGFAYPRTGNCARHNVIWGYDEYGFEHLSISTVTGMKPPTTQHIEEIISMFFKDDETVFQIYKRNMVRVNRNVIHIWKPIKHKFLVPWEYEEGDDSNE